MAVGLAVGLGAGLALGLLAGLVLAAARRARSAAEHARLTAELEHVRRTADARAAAWEEDRQRLVGSFADLSREALQRNSEEFLVLAGQRLRQAQEGAAGDLAQRQQAITQLLAPFRETLDRYQAGLRQLELDRQGAYRDLSTRVVQLTQSQEQLQRETRQLVTALRSPQTRGRWGEVQLRRVVEMAGMLRHCDFDEQVHTAGESGRLRPDMVVHLPGGGEIVVDAKVPLDAFLRAIESEDDDERKALLLAHARQLREHVDQMSQREYWRHVGSSAEQVVVFIPGDSLLSAAYEHDPTLQEHAMANGVLLTTPTMLIALLRTVAYGWRQEVLADNAREVQRLGAELYDRLRRMGGHLAKLQRSLSGTVEAFNQTVGSLESRVLVTARKFPDLGAGLDADELTAVAPVDIAPRLLQAPELVGPDPDVPSLRAGATGLVPDDEGTPDGCGAPYGEHDDAAALQGAGTAADGERASGVAGDPALGGSAGAGVTVS